MPLFPPHKPQSMRQPVWRGPGAASPEQAGSPAKGAEVASSQKGPSVPLGSLGRRNAGASRTQEPGATASSLLRRYRPLETRATGGFGSVEVCLDTRLQRRVAIKRIPLSSPMGTAPESTRDAALAEARTASMLQHPNIVSVIDFTYDSAYAYLVMEYIDGMSLEEFLTGVEGNSLTYDEAAAVADALAQALAFAHENGVLHLDIKPANVLIDRNGHIKLADFGMATLTSAAGFGGARGGTIGYMAPEQLRGEVVDERSDVFSLAAVLYEALCATAPFRAGTPADSLKRIEKGVIYPSSLLADIPQNTEDALLCALAPNADDRPATISDFGDLFGAHLGNAREGRRSLARIIARLTADDDAEESGGETTRARRDRVWELDPAQGWLGSRTNRARALVTGAVAGVSVAGAAAALLAALGLAEGAALAAAAVAIGAAAAIAPAIGSALVVTGFVMLVLGATPIVGALAPVALTVAIVAGWWYAWGRTLPASSAVFAAFAALSAVTGDPVLFCGPVAVFAGCALPAAPAAASCVLGIPFARLFQTALATDGLLDAAEAASSLAHPALWSSTALAALAAATTALLLDRHARNLQNSRGNAMLIAASTLPPIMVVLLLCLAHPVEIASLVTYRIAIALGVGALSSIIVCMYVYALGYLRDLPEGD